MSSQVNRRVLYTFISALIILAGTFFAIQYAKGRYRLTQQGILHGTGLLNANSSPTAAQVFINTKLTTATDDIIYLEPGEYDVEIVKDGYSPWRKKMLVESELVAQTNAQLFPIAPSLTPITLNGIQNISPSPDGTKIIYYTASASAQSKNGLYLLELNSSPLSFQKGSRFLAEDTASFNLAEAEFIWAPDSSEVLLVSGDKNIMLDLSQKTTLSTAPDVSLRKKQLLAAWEEDMYLREREYMTLFPPEIIAVATQSAKNVYFSPDKKKLLYTASSSATIPENIVPPVPAKNTQPESRTLEPGSIYVYDREEDKNFKLGTEKNATDLNDKKLLAIDLYSRQAQTLESSPSAFQKLQATTSAQTTQNFKTYHTSLYARTLQWLADSRHLIYSANNEIRVIEYDGTNDTTLYAGPLADSFVYPWPDGSKLLILTSFSPNSPVNLYGIDLK